MTNLDSILKSRDITLPTKVHLIKGMVFLVVMYGCESWTTKSVLKNWCFWTVVLEKTLESPLDCKEIPPVHPKGNQFWIFTGRTDAEAEAPILWPPDENWLSGKDLDAGKDWRQEEGMTEDEMIGWHHWLNGHKFEQAPGTGDEQGTLVCCNPWVTKSQTWLSDWTDFPRNVTFNQLILNFLVGRSRKPIDRPYPFPLRRMPKIIHFLLVISFFLLPLCLKNLSFSEAQPSTSLLLDRMLPDS